MVCRSVGRPPIHCHKPCLGLEPVWLKLCFRHPLRQVITSDDESDGGSTEERAPSDDGDDVYEIEAPSPAVAPKVWGGRP